MPRLQDLVKYDSTLSRVLDTEKITDQLINYLEVLNSLRHKKNCLRDLYNLKMHVSKMDKASKIVSNDQSQMVKSMETLKNTQKLASILRVLIDQAHTCDFIEEKDSILKGLRVYLPS